MTKRLKPSLSQEDRVSLLRQLEQQYLHSSATLALLQLKIVQQQLSEPALRPRRSQSSTS